MQNLADLTPRELEVLQLVIAGKTNKAIAKEIYISAKTVEFHLDNIYTKIGVRTRMLAGIWAIHNGMHTDPRDGHHRISIAKATGSLELRRKL